MPHAASTVVRRRWVAGLVLALVAVLALTP